MLEARVARFLQRRGRVECALRVVDGTHPGLSGKWRPGIATLTPGGIAFRRQVGGFRFLRGPTVEVGVLGVGPVRESGLPWWRVWGVPPHWLVVTLLTSTATVEWALAPKLAAWAREQVTSRDN